MIIIVGPSLVPAGERDRVVDALRDLVRRARAFDGRIDVAITANPIDPRRITNLEIWEASEPLDRWRAEASAPDLGIELDAAAVKRYDATDGGPLF